MGRVKASVDWAASISPHFDIAEALTNSCGAVIMSYGIAKPGGFWKRPINRTYHYNFEVGENYYLPMTTYLESKSSMPPMTMAALEKEMEKMEVEKSKMLTRTEPPGALGFSERLARRWITGRTDYSSALRTTSATFNSSSTTTASY